MKYKVIRHKHGFCVVREYRLPFIGVYERDWHGLFGVMHGSKNLCYIFETKQEAEEIKRQYIERDDN